MRLVKLCELPSRIELKTGVLLLDLRPMLEKLGMAGNLQGQTALVQGLIEAFGQVVIRVPDPGEVGPPSVPKLLIT